MCPLPLRLGELDGSGITAADHARICADLAAMMRSVPVWRMTIARSGNRVDSVTHRGVNGQSLAVAPTVSGSGTFDYAFVNYLAYDSLGEIVVAAERVMVFPGVGQTTPIRVIRATNGLFRVYGIDDGATCCLVAYGNVVGATTGISIYGGALDKRDCQTEAVPYAWVAYRMLQDARGSAYSKESSGLVHVENQALARGHAARWRDCERVACNSNPSTAFEKSEEWRISLGVRLRADDTEESVRARCAAKFLACKGPTRIVVDTAVQQLLGNLFVKTWRCYLGADEIGTPPTITCWPTANPGIPNYDLGGGAWYSERSHLLVEVTRPSDVGVTEFLDKMDQLYELLDRLLPATATFDWAVNVEGGFELDVDQLDYGCLGRL
jgi:hypothetical protein